MAPSVPGSHTGLSYGNEYVKVDQIRNGCVAFLLLQIFLNKLQFSRILLAGQKFC